MSKKKEKEEFPAIKVSVLEKGQKPKSSWKSCIIGEHISFDTSKLETYCLAPWQSVIFDMMLLAAAVEFCDRVKRRPLSGRGRNISLRLPVHEPERWNADNVLRTLYDALSFLTGDIWNISFTARKNPESPPRQSSFAMPTGARAVIPFSDGMDSRAVAELLAATEYKGDSLIRIRLGSHTIDTANERGRPLPFTSVPYKVKKLDYAFPETSARTRGFKFLLLGGVVAYSRNRKKR